MIFNERIANKMVAQRFREFNLGNLGFIFSCLGVWGYLFCCGLGCPPPHPLLKMVTFIM